MSGSHCLTAPSCGEGLQAEVRQHHPGRLAGVGKGRLCQLLYTRGVTLDCSCSSMSAHAWCLVNALAVDVCYVVVHTYVLCSLNPCLINTSQLRTSSFCEQ